MRDQIPKVRDVVAALGIPVYEREGFEADDVIATLKGQAAAAVTGRDDPHRRPGHAPAGDRRTRLLVSLRGGTPNTVHLRPGAASTERWGLLPDQMLDYKALKGDSTDNIPGIPGVGEKTAAKLIGTFGTLDHL